MEMLDQPEEKMMVSTVSVRPGVRAARGTFQIIIINAMVRLGSGKFSLCVLIFFSLKDG